MLLCLSTNSKIFDDIEGSLAEAARELRAFTYLKVRGYRKQLRPTLLRIDTYLVRWARWKFKRLRRRHWGAREWLARVRCANPTLFSPGASCMSAAERSTALAEHIAARRCSRVYLGPDQS